jgi:hypothetical protein
MRPPIAAVVAVWLWPHLAAAQPNAKVVEEATRRLRKGNILYDQGSYEQALRLYVAAYELVPSPDILFNLALAKEKVLDYEGCALSFAQYLREAPQDDPARARADERYERCRERAEVTVKVSSIPPGAAILMGKGEAASFRGRTPAEFRLKPGSYPISIQMPGYVSMNQILQVDIGQHPEVDFPLEKLSTLGIEADVGGAFVVINNERPEPLPIRRELRAGLYQLKIFKPGHRTVTRQARIAPGEQSTLVVSLPVSSARQTLQITANTPATVSINGRSAGITPLSAMHRPGRVAIRLSAPGRVPYLANWELEPDKPLALAVDLSRQRPPTKQRILYGLWAATGASAAGGLIFGVLALKDERTFRREPSLVVAERGDSRARRADLLLGSAAISAGAALVFHYLTRPKPSGLRRQ